MKNKNNTIARLFGFNREPKQTPLRVTDATAIELSLAHSELVLKLETVEAMSSQVIELAKLEDGTALVISQIETARIGLKEFHQFEGKYLLNYKEIVASEQSANNYLVEAKARLSMLDTVLFMLKETYVALLPDEVELKNKLNELEQAEQYERAAVVKRLIDKKIKA